MALPVIHKYCTLLLMNGAAITPGVLYFLTDKGEIWFDTPDNTRISMGNGGGGDTPTGDIDTALSPTSTNPVQNKTIFNAIKTLQDNFAELDFSQVGGTGKYIETIKQVGGKVTATEKSFTNATLTADGFMSKEDKALVNKIPATGDIASTVYVDTTVDNAIKALDVTDIAVAGKYVSSVSEIDGKISVTREELNKASTSNDGLMAKEDKTKLDGIEEGAAVQIPADWNQTNAAALDFIKNKPTLGSAAAMEPEDIIDTITYAQFKAAATSAASKADAAGVELKENKGATNGYTPLENGKVPIEYLPAYVSEIKEFDEKSMFPATGDLNFLYYAKDEEKTYRWGGTQYVEVPNQLALGTTANTAFAGNKGQTAYEHAMKKGAEFKSATNGVALLKFKTNEEGHVVLASPVTKEDIEELGISGGGGGDGTTYSAGTGIKITGTVIKNIGATNAKESTVDGNVIVTVNDADKEVPVHGLKSAAFMEAKTALNNNDAEVPTSKAVATYVTTQLADYQKTDEVKEYSLAGTVDKVQLKVDGVVKDTVNLRGKANWNAAAGADNEILNKPDIYTKTEADSTFWKKDDGNLSDNNFTDAFANKLTAIEEGAEKNKNGYGKITVGTTVLSASNDEDTFALVEGSNITITADATTKKITISSSGGGGGDGSYDDTALKARISAVESTVLAKEDKTVVATKADKSDTYTKSQVDAALALKADASDSYTKTQIDTKLNDKANSSDVYTKTQSDATFALKTDIKEYTMTKSADGKKINLVKDGAIVSTIDDAQGGEDGEAITYTVSKTGDKIKLTGSNGSSSTADLDTYEFGLENVAETTTTPGSASLKLKKTGAVVSSQAIVTGLKFDNGTTTTPADWQSGNITISKKKIGLSKVEDKSAADILGEMTTAQIAAALGFTPEDPSHKGSANGYAELDSTGKVPATQLPAYISEVKEFATKTAFPATGDKSIIYVALDTLTQYRWSGTAYTPISSGGGGGVELGETAATAYRGDRGKEAYDHATEAKVGANAVGLYKFSTTANGHIASVVAVTDTDLEGLGFVKALDITDAINALDVSEVGSATGKYISSIKQVDGKIVATATDFADASETTSGLMSADDKKKLNAIAEEATKVEYTRTVTTGDKIGTIKINGTATDILVPEVEVLDEVKDGDMKPVTSNAVYKVVGDIEAILATI